ncbi:hypothetical protein PR001_g9575 [Phytophthora rubi]|nr:hypothetical protein PR001_g9575 [Phytophthora rubi]
MKKKFKLSSQAFENAVWNIQGADNHDAYAKAVQALGDSFGTGVMEYVKEIGPGVWTVHANMTTYVSPRDDGHNGSDLDDSVPFSDGGNIRSVHMCVEPASLSSTDRVVCGHCNDPVSGGTQSDLAVSISDDHDRDEDSGDCQPNLVEEECECSDHRESRKAVPMFK